MAKRKVSLTREPRTAYLAEADHFRKFAELCNKLYSGLVARRDGWGRRNRAADEEGRGVSGKRGRESEKDKVKGTRRRRCGVVAS